MAISIDPATRPVATATFPDGLVERAEYLGPPGARVLTLQHVPTAQPRAAVVICSPIHGEFARNYRREVLFARRLARDGIAVERFHYRCTGNSDGDGEHLTFDSMVEDSLSCVEHLLREAGEVPLVIVGARWGSIVAASTAARSGAAVAVVLWEPLLDASRFFKDAFRNKLVKEKRAGAIDIETSADLERRLLAGESVDVVAHRIEVELYRTSAGRTLGDELGTDPRDLLVVQLGTTGTLRREIVQQVEHWQTAGLRVDTAVVRGEEAWWLVDETLYDEGSRPVTQELVTVSTDWIGRRALPPGGSSR
ncbi:MAG TPA: alpha/beta hydrolase [Actinomycetota bacterium]